MPRQDLGQIRRAGHPVSPKRHVERQSSDWRVVATKKNPIAERLGVLKLLPQRRAMAGRRGVGGWCRPVSPYACQIRSLASQSKLNLSNATIWLAGWRRLRRAPTLPDWLWRFACLSDFRCRAVAGVKQAGMCLEEFDIRNSPSPVLSHSTHGHLRSISSDDCHRLPRCAQSAGRTRSKRTPVART